MKTTRTKVVLTQVVCIALLVWLAAEFTGSPKTRAPRIHSEHNIITAPISTPASAPAPSTGQRLDW